MLTRITQKPARARRFNCQDGTAPAALASSEGWWSNSFFSNLFGHE
jgi:hypothetical protein